MQAALHMCITNCSADAKRRALSDENSVPRVIIISRRDRNSDNRR